MFKAKKMEESVQVIKVVLLGDSGVGKSSLALRFVTDEFKPYTSTTIGASFMSKTVSFPPNTDGSEVEGAAKPDGGNVRTDCEKKIAFKIWDTAGQEKYHSLAPMYYRGSGAAIVVYDITKGATFDTIQSWVEELKSNGPPNIVIIVCGNKCDLNECRKVDAAEARNYAQSIGGTFLETSAKNAINVNEIFREVARRVPGASKHDDNVATFEEDGRFNLGGEDPADTGWLSWC